MVLTLSAVTHSRLLGSKNVQPRNDFTPGAVDTGCFSGGLSCVSRISTVFLGRSDGACGVVSVMSIILHEERAIGRGNRKIKMKTPSRTWFTAPLVLSGIWVLSFIVTTESSSNQPWWYTFVLHPGNNALTALTTGLFHADAGHLISNVVLLFFISYSFRSCLNFVTVILLWWCVAPCAALVSYTIDPAPLIGASGGIFGIFGGALFYSIDFTKRHASTVIIWLVAFVLVASVPGDIIAHLAGAIFGYGGCFLVQKVFSKPSRSQKQSDLQ